MHFKYLILGFIVLLQTSYASDSFMMLSGDSYLEPPNSFNVKVYRNTQMPTPHDIMYLKELITGFHMSLHSNGLGENDRRDDKVLSLKKFNLHEEEVMKGLCQLIIVRKGDVIKGGGFIYLRPGKAVFLKCAGLMTDEDESLTFKTMFDFLSSKENFPDRDTLTVFMQQDQKACKTLAAYGFKLTGRSLSDYSGDQYDFRPNHLKTAQRYEVLQKSIE